MSSQTIDATLDIQAGTLIPSPAQTGSQPWKLGAPGIEGSSELLVFVRLTLLPHSIRIPC